MMFSICTPTYNRKNCLNRVYESLCKQTYCDFEWIVVDDGSSDGTEELVQEYIDNANFPIVYRFKENGGKHTAVNMAVQVAQGEFIVIADSDDIFKETALEEMLNAWNEIPKELRGEFRGVTCRCYDPENGEKVGEDFPEKVMDITELDAKFKYHFQYEMWGMIKREVMEEYPFPEEFEHKLRFYPESIIWDQMARKYKTRYIDKALRGYYKDQDDATTVKKARREAENIWLWKHYINDLDDYFRYQPVLFFKAYLGLARDGIRLGKNYSDIIKMVESSLKKILFTIIYPFGWVLAHR